ncbi:MAG: TolC family protein [Marinifilaceae bacterium]
MNKNNLNIMALTMILMSLSFHIRAQETLSLEQAIVKALEQNFGIQRICKETKIAKTNNTWGAAGRQPKIDFVSNFSLEKNYNNNDNWLQNNLNAGVELDWVLFDGFRVNITKAKLNELQALSEGNLQVLMENTIKDLMLAYYSAQLEYQKLNVADFILEQSKERLTLEEQKNKIGLEGTYALLQAKNAFLEDIRTYNLQELNYNDAIRQLNLILSEGAETEYILIDSIPVDMHPYNFDELKAKTISSNSNLKNQLINIKLAERQTELAKSNYYPTLSAQTGLSTFNRNTNYSNAGSSNLNSGAAYVGLSLKYNLFSGGERSRAKQIAVINKDIATIEKNDMEYVIISELHSCFERFGVMQNLYEYAVENLKAAELNLKISTDKFEAGVINSFNFRDIQILYRNSALVKLEATYDLTAAKVDLMLLSGSILSD